MEITKNQNIKETLLLTNTVFNTLLKEVIRLFKRKHNIPGPYKDFQLFGFGNYDSDLPNLKNDLELILKGYVNGKYLYNKSREASTGKPLIKISREYKYLFFNYLGYVDIDEFIQQSSLKEDERNAQQKLSRSKSSIRDYFYVCYYYGEDRRMNKGQVIIRNGWKNIEMRYIYGDDHDKKSIYSFFGNIIQNQHFIFIDTKYYQGSKRNEGAKFTFFVGKSSPDERQYLIGTYSGFDKYDRAIAGKIILQKFDSIKAVEGEISNTEYNPIISMELTKKRIIVESNIRKNPLNFSKKSPYAQALMAASQKYVAKFKVDGKEHSLKIEIEKPHYNIVSLTDFVFIEDDYVSIVNKGQILNLDFYISGMFQLQKVSIYLKIIDFFKTAYSTYGNFNGVDINNNLVAGKVDLSPID